MALLAISQASNHIRTMSGNKIEENISTTSAKKPKPHTLRKFDDKIAVQFQRQEETKKLFQEAMRDIGEMKNDSYSYTRMRNWDLMRDPDNSSPQEMLTNTSIISPPGSGGSLLQQRVEWNSVYRDYDEINKKIPSNKRPCRRRSTGHAHNDIRTSTSPYPTIYYDNSIGGGSWDIPSPNETNGNFISRVKSDSDLHKALDMVAPPNIPLPTNFPRNFAPNPTTPLFKKSTPDSHTLLHPPNNFPPRWGTARQRHSTMNHGPIRKIPSFSRKRAATSSENQKSYPPSSFNGLLAHCNTQVTSLPDLTDVNFQSGLERPIDFEDFQRNIPFTSSEHPKATLSQHSRQQTQQNNVGYSNNNQAFPYLDHSTFLSHSQNPKLFSQQQNSGYFDDAYLDLQSEPYYASSPRRMFNSTISVQEMHPLSYSQAPNMTNSLVKNRPLLQRQSTNTILTSQSTANDPFNPMGLPLDSLTLGPPINEASYYSPNHSLTHDPHDFQGMNVRPSSARSVPGYSYSRDNIAHMQEVRGLDLHSTITPENVYDTSNFTNFGSLQANSNLHKSDPTLQTIQQTLPPPYPDQMCHQADMMNSIPFDISDVFPDQFLVPEDLHLGQLKKGHSFDFNNINLTGNKTPVQENYNSFSKFASVPKMMYDYGVRNPRTLFDNSNMIDPIDSAIDLLIQKDSMAHFESDLLPPELATNFLPYLDNSNSPPFPEQYLH